jgi:hypothetical protein
MRYALINLRKKMTTTTKVYDQNLYPQWAHSVRL